MMGKTIFKKISGRERAIEIAKALFTCLIFAIGISFFAPWIFIWIADLFDPIPKGQRDCQFMNYLDQPLNAYQKCLDRSNSYHANIRRLRHSIPWFWIALTWFSWLYLKNPLMGKMRDDSADIIYEGEEIWQFILYLLVHILFVVAIWAFVERNTASFISLAVIIGILILWSFLDIVFRKKYGRRKSDIE